MKVFICLAEMYDGKKQPMRVFADTKEEARNQLIKQFPKFYIGEAMTIKEYKENRKHMVTDEIAIGIDKLTENDHHTVSE